MKIKNFVVPFIALFAVILLVGMVNAAEVVATDTLAVDVDGVNVHASGADTDVASVIAGETIEVEVQFEANVDASDIRIKVEIESDKTDEDVLSESFDVEAGKTYKKKLSLRVPYELKEELSEDAELYVKIWNGDHKTSLNDGDGVVVRVQRPSYNADFKSITFPQTVNAGSELAVNLVLKNIGYNDLDDLYIVAKIPALELTKTGYFGDIVCLEECDCLDDAICDARSGTCIDDDDEDTISGTLLLDIPYDAEDGVYTVEIEASNEDMVMSESRKVTINNDFPQNVVKTNSGLLMVNPTDSLKIYRVISPVGEEFVSVEAGSTETLEINANSEDYIVNVLTMDGQLVGSFDFSQSQTQETSSPIIVLTIILAIIFIVLLVVLIILIGKKPQKEEFGESYY